MLSLYTLAVTSALALQATAATIRIDVGKEGLKFSPNTTTAARGDILEFHFYPRNHSVVQGRFDQPCVPAQANAFFSGFIPTSGEGDNATIFSVTVPDTNPLVFYCSQNTGFHCAKGMYAVVNPANGNTLNGYGALIQGNVTAQNPAGGRPTGGVFSQQNGQQTSSAATTGPSATNPSTPGRTSAASTTAGAAAPTATKPGAAVIDRAPLVGVLGAALAALLI